MAAHRPALLLATAFGLAAALAACGRDDGARPGAGPAPVNQPATEPARAPDPDAPAVKLVPPDRPPVTVTVELARTPEQIRRGLMYRQHLPPDHGMLFLMAEEVVQGFWMKNTLIPLDMIFIDSSMTVVGVVENAEPLTSTSRTVGVPSRFVLEVNGGFSARHGVGAGTRVQFHNVAGFEAF